IRSKGRRLWIERSPPRRPRCSRRTAGSRSERKTRCIHGHDERQIERQKIRPHRAKKREERGPSRQGGHAEVGERSSSEGEKSKASRRDRPLRSAQKRRKNPEKAAQSGVAREGERRNPPAGAKRAGSGF